MKELEISILSVKEKCRQEIDRILNEKHEEIEKVKSEAERTTGGLRKLYQSLQVMTFAGNDVSYFSHAVLQSQNFMKKKPILTKLIG